MNLRLNQFSHFLHLPHCSALHTIANQSSQVKRGLHVSFALQQPTSVSSSSQPIKPQQLPQITTTWPMQLRANHAMHVTHATIKQTSWSWKCDNVHVYRRKSPLQLYTGIHAPTQLHLHALCVALKNAELCLYDKSGRSDIRKNTHWRRKLLEEQTMYWFHIFAQAMIESCIQWILIKGRCKQETTKPACIPYIVYYTVERNMLLC